MKRNTMVCSPGAFIQQFNQYKYKNLDKVIIIKCRLPYKCGREWMPDNRMVTVQHLSTKAPSTKYTLFLMLFTTTMTTTAMTTIISTTKTTTTTTFATTTTTPIFLMWSHMWDSCWPFLWSIFEWTFIFYLLTYHYAEL